MDSICGPSLWSELSSSDISGPRRRRLGPEGWTSSPDASAPKAPLSEVFMWTLKPLPTLLFTGFDCKPRGQKNSDEGSLGQLARVRRSDGDAGRITHASLDFRHGRRSRSKLRRDRLDADLTSNRGDCLEITASRAKRALYGLPLKRIDRCRANPLKKFRPRRASKSSRPTCAAATPRAFCAA